MKINLAQLAIGYHELDFEEPSESLDLQDQEMFPNMVHTHVMLYKSETHVYIHAVISTRAHLMCDRCLREFDRTLEGEVRLYYQLTGHVGHTHIPEDDESLDDSIRIFSMDTPEVDLGHDIRDTLLLEVPMKVLCSPECKGICPGCGRDLNVEECVCEHTSIDPRWEALKQLLE